MDPKKMQDVAEAAGLGTPDLTDLGWANGWDKTPKQWERCPHKTKAFATERELQKQVWEVRCETCGIKFKYDSSG